jgi:thioredoxin 1|tara:strand:- start:673 stop:1317 length:645 start_codon:yes stop_codon:yes gene_type:complete
MDKENKISSVEKVSDTESKKQVTTSKSTDTICDPPVAICDPPIATSDPPVAICDPVDTDISDIENEPKQPNVSAPTLDSNNELSNTFCECCNVKNSEIKFSVDNVVMGEVSEIKTKTDFLNILNDANNMLVIVDFSASWCGPCKRIMPELKTLAKNNNDNILFLKVDVDDNEETSAYCGITCMPTFQFYKNNIKVHQIEGADISAIQNGIDLYK